MSFLCAKHAASSFIADDMTHRFHSCTQRLQLALQMIPIQKQKVADEKMVKGGGGGRGERGVDSQIPE